MLLEDDDSLRESITDYLTENRYTVVAVQNGGDGVREVLAGDFVLVVCDFRMPGLPGDLFFRAVQRIRPSLCQRFVFMTGHQNDAVTDAFIKSVDGFVLQKPFPLKNLLDSIAFTEVRGMFQSVFADAADDVNPSPASEPVSGSQAGGAAGSEAAAVERILARGRKSLSAPAPSEASLESAAEPCARGMSGTFAFAGIALLLVLVGGLWVGHSITEDLLDAATVKRLAAEAEWAAVSPDLHEALALRSKAESSVKQLARLSAERAKPRWASVLRCIVPPGDTMIEILGADARADAKDPGSCEVRVHGIAGGAEPRLTADRYRQSVEENLKRDANGRAVGALFEQLEDAPEVLPDQKHADFVMIVTLGSIEPSLAMHKGGL